MAKKTALKTVCCECGEEKSSLQFYVDITTSPKDTIPICKTCGKEILREYKKAVKSVKGGLWLMLAKINIPFIQDCWIKVNELFQQQEDIDILQCYLKFLPDYLKDIQGFWQSNVMLDDIISIKTDSVSVNTTVDINDIDKLKKDWGEYSDEDWVWLEREYEENIEGIEDLTVPQAKTYRDYCKTCLNLRKAYEKGEDTKSLNEEKLKLMKLLKIDDFSSNQKSEEDRYIDRIIWKIEQTEPAEIEDEETYKDIQGFEGIFNSFMRSMKNILTGDKKYPNIPRGEE